MPTVARPCERCLPREAARLIALADDPAWHGRLLAAAQAVTGREGLTPLNAAVAIIAEKKSRLWRPTIPRVAPALVKAMNTAVVEEFWSDVDRAVADYEAFKAEFAARALQPLSMDH